MHSRQPQPPSHLKGLVAPTQNALPAQIATQLYDTEPELAVQLLAQAHASFAYLRGSSLPLELWHYRQARDRFFRLAWRENEVPLKWPDWVGTYLRRAYPDEAPIPLALHCSPQRRISTATLFLQRSPATAIQVDKFNQPLALAEQTTPRESTLFSLHWDALRGSRLEPGTPLRRALLEYLVVGDQSEFYSLWITFLRHTLFEFPHPPEKKVDAIFTNAFLDPRTRTFSYFDLEWSLDRPMPNTWYVFRNVLAWVPYRAWFSSSREWGQNLAEVYTCLCRTLSLTPDFEGDLSFETELQYLATPTDRAPATHGIRLALQQSFSNGIVLPSLWQKIQTSTKIAVKRRIRRRRQLVTISN